MLVVTSPAKALNMEPVGHDRSDPLFPNDTNGLIHVLREKSVADVKKLMKLSDKLAQLNVDRYRDFMEAPTGDVLKPAALAFDGDTYRGLEAKTLSEDDLRWAQDHYRILSGLYGLLRPMDAIQAHRLEMGTRLKTDRGASLYQYWGDQIAEALVAQAAEIGTDTLINCASEEYFRAAGTKKLTLNVVTPVFLEDKDGTQKVVSFYAKQARGAMARFVIQNRLTNPADLTGFETGGYQFDPDQSSETRPVFVRSYPG
jgi:cytoplasmic iron level regulating protein YaaA (DUF328/UPF0246 family)